MYVYIVEVIFVGSLITSGVNFSDVINCTDDSTRDDLKVKIQML